MTLTKLVDRSAFETCSVLVGWPLQARDQRRSPSCAVSVLMSVSQCIVAGVHVWLKYVTEPFGHIDKVSGGCFKVVMTTEPFGQYTERRRTMFRYRERSEPTRSAEAGGDWVDFPASTEPDPWSALLREAKLLPPDVFGTGRSTRQGATHQIAPPARGRAHRAAEPEAVTGKNG